MVDNVANETLLSIPHVRQSQNWDCGLACIRMVLSYLGIEQNTFNKVCDDLGFETSVWTIDLACILSRYNVSHRYCTVLDGVNTDYKNEVSTAA